MALPVPQVIVSPDSMPRTKFGVPPLLNLFTTWRLELPLEPPVTDETNPEYNTGDARAVTHILYRIIESATDQPTRNGEPVSETNQQMTAEDIAYLFGSLEMPEWSTDSMWSAFSGMDTADSGWSVLTGMAPLLNAEDSEWSNVAELSLDTIDSAWSGLQLPVDPLFPDNLTDLDERDEATQLRDVLTQRNDDVEGVRVDPPEWHILPASEGSYSGLRYFDLVFELAPDEIMAGQHQNMFSGVMNPEADNLDPTTQCYWIMAVLGVDANDILRGYDATP